MKWFLLVSLLFALVEQTRSNGSCNNFVYGPPKKLNTDPYIWANIYVGRRFNCNVMIRRIHFYANRAGEFFVSFWRRVSGGNSYQLARKLSVRAQRAGQDFLYLTDEGRMMVREGYVLGVHSPDNSVKGVVSIENSYKPRTSGYNPSYLLNYVNFNKQDSSLPENVVVNYPTATTTKRAPAMMVYGTEIQALGSDTVPRKIVDSARNFVLIPNANEQVESDGYINRIEFLARKDRDTKIKVLVFSPYRGRFRLRFQQVIGWLNGITRIVRYTPADSIRVYKGDRIAIGFYTKSPVPFDHITTGCSGRASLVIYGAVNTVRTGSSYLFKPVTSLTCRDYSLQVAVGSKPFGSYINEDDNESGFLYSDSQKTTRSLELRAEETSSEPAVEREENSDPKKSDEERVLSDQIYKILGEENGDEIDLTERNEDEAELERDEKEEIEKRTEDKSIAEWELPNKESRELDDNFVTEKRTEDKSSSEEGSDEQNNEERELREDIVRLLQGKE